MITHHDLMDFYFFQTSYPNDLPIRRPLIEFTPSTIAFNGPFLRDHVSMFLRNFNVYNTPSSTLSQTTIARKLYSIAPSDHPTTLLTDFLDFIFNFEGLDYYSCLYE
jgi:hypothetical protein